MARRSDHVQTIKMEGHGGLVDLAIEHELPDLDGLIARAKDLRPLWERIIALGWLKRADAYERDDRYRGGLGRPDKDGRRRNWGPGYGPYQKDSRTKKLLKANFRRPYPPTFDDDLVLRVTNAALTYLTTGELP